jgi:two-component system OmpR family response regulator
MLRVLIVDDDTQTCEYIREFLYLEGHLATIQQNPLLVLQTLEDEHYDLVLLDMMLPQASGLDIFKKIREIDEEISVAIITGHPDVNTAIASIDLQATGYLQKPFRLEQLEELLSKISARASQALQLEDLLLRSIGRSLRDIRKEKTLTLKELSQKTKLSVSLLSQIERGKANPTILTLHKIAHAMGVSVAAICPKS